MIRKSVVLVSVIAASLFSAEVDYHGFIKTEVGTDLPVEEFDPSYFAENDIKLVGEVKLNDGVSVGVTFRSLSSVGVDRTDAATIDKGYGADQNGTYIFSDNQSRLIYTRRADPNILPIQVLAKWNFTKNGTLLLGDYSYSAGQTNFFRAADSLKYGSIMREQSLRGFGVQASGLTAFVGMVDSIKGSMGIYAAYDFTITDKPKTKMTVKPVFDMVLLGDGDEDTDLFLADDSKLTRYKYGRDRTWNIGAEGFYSSYFNAVEYSVNGAFGMLPYASENTYTFLVEPSLNIGGFTLGAGLFYASLSNEEIASYRQSDMPEQYFTYLEPSYELHPKVSIGMLYEYHDLSFKSDKDASHVFTPAFYIYPNDALEIWAMSGMTFNEDFDEAHISMTIKSALRF